MNENVKGGDVIKDALGKIETLYEAEKDKNLLLDAYYYAQKMHEGQKRASGEPYFIHPCAVANILMDMGLDAPTIAAAFLHDVVEDTVYTEEQLTEISALLLVFSLWHCVRDLVPLSGGDEGMRAGFGVREIFHTAGVIEMQVREHEHINILRRQAFLGQCFFDGDAFGDRIHFFDVIRVGVLPVVVVAGVIENVSGGRMLDQNGKRR